MITTAEIIHAVTLTTEISAEEIKGPIRSQRVVWARWLVIALLRQQNPHWSNADIAQSLARDTSTIHHAIKGIQNLLETNRQFRSLHEQATLKLYPLASLSA